GHSAFSFGEKDAYYSNWPPFLEIALIRRIQVDLFYPEFDMKQEEITTFEFIKKLEITLHSEKRNNRNWLHTVLHDDFLEISKSGFVSPKIAVIDALLAEIKTTISIFSQNYAMRYLDENIILLTYQSYEIDQTGAPCNQALRSSIWQKSANNKWQLRFHQGTLMANDTDD
ncbi:DUF4440 domain-containing protein, partial [Xenorhabdus mauleonii]